MGPFLQQLSQTQQEHDRGRGVKVPPDHGYPNGQAIQQFHVELAPQQTAQPPQQVGDGLPKGIGRPQRRREKQRAGKLESRQSHQFFLVDPVQRTPAVRDRQLLPMGVGKVPDIPQQRRPVHTVQNNGAACPLMHSGLLHPVDRLKVRLQTVRLFQRHPRLGQADTHAPPALVQYLKLHIIASTKGKGPLPQPSQGLTFPGRLLPASPARPAFH